MKRLALKKCSSFQIPSVGTAKTKSATCSLAGVESKDEIQGWYLVAILLCYLQVL
jgi:hypothetical protein